MKLLLALHILFIGNSLTYSNDMPEMVERMAAADGVEVVTETVAFPGFSLEDHLRDGRALKALRGRKWDVVVLQQGPSSLDESRLLLIRDAKAFAAHARAAGCGTVAVLNVWPARRNAGAFDRVNESHRLAAEAAGALLIPAGVEWQKALRAGGRGAHLYGPDGFHPSREGSRLTAATVYRTLRAHEDRP